jgi:threonine dehydrogenase-like Zn-dependent dehydrogenase
MKAVVWLGPRQMEVQEMAEPTPSAGEVVIKVEAVGICGSELSGYLGQNSLRVPPLIMGHEFSGRVEALGEGVTGLNLGDLVTVNPLITCGKCVFCQQGLENLCVQRKLIGAHRSGAFAEFVTVPAINCIRLPSTFSTISGSLAEPLACGVRSASVGGVGKGSRVLIIGAGTIGLMCIAAVRKAGGSVTLISDVHPGRLATAAAWGTEATCDARTTDTASEAHQRTEGLGVDVAIDAVGSDVTRQAAVKAVRSGGSVVLVGLHAAESPFEANYLVRSEIHVTGSFAYTPANFAQAVEMLLMGEVQPSAQWLEERSLMDCAAAFAQLVDAPSAAAKIVLRP